MTDVIDEKMVWFKFTGLLNSATSQLNAPDTLTLGEFRERVARTELARLYRVPVLGLVIQNRQGREANPNQELLQILQGDYGEFDNPIMVCVVMLGPNVAVPTAAILQRTVDVARQAAPRAFREFEYFDVEVIPRSSTAGSSENQQTTPPPQHQGTHPNYPSNSSTHEDFESRSNTDSDF